jgi:hypothetical protein
MAGSYYLQLLLQRIRCSVSVPTVFVICFPTASSLYISHKTRTNKLRLRASHLTRGEIPQNCGYFSTQVATRVKYLGSWANSDLFLSVLASFFFSFISPFLRPFFFYFLDSFFYFYPTYLRTYVYVLFYLTFSIHRSIRPSVSPYTCLT